jgi:hypothetical protein
MCSVCAASLEATTTTTQRINPLPNNPLNDNELLFWTTGVDVDIIDGLDQIFKHQNAMEFLYEQRRMERATFAEVGNAMYAGRSLIFRHIVIEYGEAWEQSWQEHLKKLSSGL